MRILILQGSPNRDGSTALLAEEFSRGGAAGGPRGGARRRGTCGRACGTPGMTRASRHLREAFELGASL